MTVIAVAHVGYGYWGRNLARSFSQIDALRAVVDANPAAAQDAATTFNVTAMTFAQAIGSKDIDAISIASPAELHYSLALAALKNGKHVFVEKPLALDVGEAEHLTVVARENGLVLMVGHLLQYHPCYTKLLDIVRSGELGAIRYAYSNRLSLGKLRTEENVLWSFAPHDFSMLLGLFDSEPTNITAQGCVAYSPGVADFVTVQMRFPGGSAAHIQVSWMHPFKEQKLVVLAERGMAVFEDSNPDWDQKLTVYDHVIDASGTVPVVTKGEARFISVTKGEPLMAECRHFISAIENGTEPRTGGAEGLRVLKALDAAETALRQTLRLSL